MKTSGYGFRLHFLLIVCASIGLVAGSALGQDDDCGTAGGEQTFSQFDSNFTYPNADTTVKVLVLFAKLPSLSTVDCQDDPDDGWPDDTTAALPGYAHRLVCSTYPIASDPNQFSVYPYRGNLTHFYYDMSAGKHVVYGGIYPETVRLAYGASHYDSLKSGLGQHPANLEIMESIDPNIDFSGTDYDYDQDGWVDVPILIFYRKLYGLGQPRAGALFGQDYVTDNTVVTPSPPFSPGFVARSRGARREATLDEPLPEA